MYKVFYVRRIIQPLYIVSRANHEFRKTGLRIVCIDHYFFAHHATTYQTRTGKRFWGTAGGPAQGRRNYANRLGGGNRNFAADDGVLREPDRVPSGEPAAGVCKGAGGVGGSLARGGDGEAPHQGNRYQDATPLAADRQTGCRR